MASGKQEFFGKIDRDRDGVIASEYPAWYFETHIENMREEMESLKRRINRGEIPHDGIPQAEAEVRNIKERLDVIENSRPKLDDKERDDLLALHKELSGHISDSMFTRSEMQMGLASPHEEARRMVGKLINISPKLKGLASVCNVQMEGGKISRNDATRMWKMIGKLTGIGTNVEGLRKDRATVLTKA